MCPLIGFQSFPDFPERCRLANDTEFSTSPGVDLADLILKTETIGGIENTRKVGLAGAIDASTVIKFQAELDKLKHEEGVRRFLLDMEGIRYVNSTGLGSLVKLADGLEKDGGVIALMRIHPKVKVVFDMLGLNAFFKIFDDDATAIEYLKKAGEEGVAQEELIPIEPEPKPKPTYTPPPKTKPEPAPERAPEPAPTPAKAVEAPAVEIMCENCELTLTVRGTGDFRCPRCFHVFKRAGDGSVEHTGRRKPIPVQMTLTGHDFCIEGLKRFVEVMAEDLGFKDNDINGLREAITQTLHGVFDLAYDKNRDLSIQVLLTGGKGEITIRIADHGTVFDAGDGRFASVRKGNIEFSHIPHPNGGNIIRITKKV